MPSDDSQNTVCASQQQGGTQDGNQQAVHDERQTRPAGGLARERGASNLCYTCAATAAQKSLGFFLPRLFSFDGKSLLKSRFITTAIPSISR